jgi:hypothetical protein
MNNGSNSWGVGYPLIRFAERIVYSHANVVDAQRHDDICFEIEREEGEDIRLVCINEYTCSLAKVFEVLEAFPGTGIIFIGGEWNGYTWQAKEHCIQNKLGLYNSKEINGALYKPDYWNYHQKDDKGYPWYPCKG